MKSIAIIGAGAVALGACASSGAIPADKLAQSQAAIRSAQEVGAERVPPAAVQLKVANDELEMARRLIENGDNKRAEYVLLRAEADADVALSIAREANARSDAERTIIEVQRLKNSRPEGT